MLHLNAHDKPPEGLKSIFKKYQKITKEQLTQDGDVLDLGNLHCAPSLSRISSLDWIRSSEIIHAFDDFSDTGPRLISVDTDGGMGCVQVYESEFMPGLLILPGLVPLNVQKAIMGKLFHRDLQNNNHKTNVHLHHDITYPINGQSFFSLSLSDLSMIQPKDPIVHKPMTIAQFMNKKLRWMTLGGQYDWTEKVYPPGKPPAFPEDLSNLLQTLFPQTKPEAAIVNLYSPGDTLSLHRDVSEDCDRGLISLSIGCDALFVVGHDHTGATQPVKQHLILRLRSGDAVYMTGSSRHAWHGVPAILSDTCPKGLENWPDEEQDQSPHTAAGIYSHWRGWMASKRINLNVRQVKE